MLEFLVLGQIPGTNIQITFEVFKNLMLLLLTLVMIYQSFKYELALHPAYSARKIQNVSNQHFSLFFIRNHVGQKVSKTSEIEVSNQTATV